MNALKRWNQLKDLETFQHGLDNLLGRASLRRPEGQEEPMAVAEWSPLVDISEDDKEYLHNLTVIIPGTAAGTVRKRHSTVVWATSSTSSTSSFWRSVNLT